MSGSFSATGSQQWYKFGVRFDVPRFERIDDMNVYFHAAVL